MNKKAIELVPISRSDLSRASHAERSERVIERAKNAGIEGLGGGLFPTAQKIASGKNAGALLVNGLQSEPDNHSDIALLQEHPKTTLAGASLIAAACGIPSLTLALPTGLDKSLREVTQSALQEELNWLNSFATNECSARQVYVKSDHASGQEHQLAFSLGLIDTLSASERRLPLVQLGVLCINLSTCHALARAVYDAQPLAERLVTVNGAPEWIKFGTSVNSVLTPAWINGRHGGGPAELSSALVDGSVFCISNPPPPPSAPCINCSACRPVCPVDLAPDEIFRAIASADSRGGESNLALDNCIECGACNAACPSGLWLTQEFRQAKMVQREALARDQAAIKAKTRVQARAARLEADKQQRAQQRKDREERLRAKSTSGTAQNGAKRTW